MIARHLVARAPSTTRLALRALSGGPPPPQAGEERKNQSRPRWKSGSGGGPQTLVLPPCQVFGRCGVS